MVKTPVPVEQLSFEKAFSELEDVVKNLESNPASLEEAITQFERGQALAQRCAQLLDHAELRVQKLSSEALPPNDTEED